MIWCRTLVDGIWGWYVRFFRVMSITCEVRPALEVHLSSQGFSTGGLDPQLGVRPIEKPLLSGWYRLTYDASHGNQDDLFVPKIFPGYLLNEEPDLAAHHPRGFAEKNSVGLFLRSKADDLAEVGQSTSSVLSDTNPRTGSARKQSFQAFSTGVRNQSTAAFAR